MGSGMQIFQFCCNLIFLWFLREPQIRSDSNINVDENESDDAGRVVEKQTMKSFFVKNATCDKCIKLVCNLKRAYNVFLFLVPMFWVKTGKISSIGKKSWILYEYILNN